MKVYSYRNLTPGTLNKHTSSINWGECSEPLPSHLNVNFVCVYVCMYVCHGPAQKLFLILMISTNFTAHVL